jgi:aryl-alcohol dehydrogenase-like predicted oxidoreductase
MQYRKLGNTGLKVSEIGLGATQLGDVDIPLAQAEAVLVGALDSGINFIDTAARYFESEERIGRFISHRKEDFIVATKCGGYRVRNETGEFESHRDYSRKGILETIDRSRKRMNMDVIDIVQFHGLPGEADDWKEAFDALREAKERGWAKFIGLSADGKTAVDSIGDWPLDTHELNYNILWQEPDRELIPHLQRLGRGIIAKRPVANAVYIGDLYAQGEEANRMRERLEQFPLVELAKEMPLFEFVLRFTLSNPAIATAIIGTANPDHVKMNATLSDGNTLPSETLEKARREYWRVP